MHRLRLESSKSNGDSPKRTLEAMKNENDLDRQMNELFDFDSAANSPGDSISTETSSHKPIAGMAMPRYEQPTQKTERSILQPHNQRRQAVGALILSISKFSQLPIISNLIWLTCV